MRFYLLFVLALIFSTSVAQQLEKIQLHEEGNISVFIDENDQEFKPTDSLPLFSFQLQDKSFTSADKPTNLDLSFEAVVHGPGFKGIITFKNISRDTLHLKNVVPFSIDNNIVYISGKGNHPLSRTHLFLPDKQPVNVIVPDNAWELGFCAVAIDSMKSVAALTRRDNASLDKATRRRFETIIFPGGSVRYNYYADFYAGEWQQGLRLFFQERMLYDLPAFDSTLYQRDDLKWIRESYVMHLIMAWDKAFYDRNKFTLPDFVKRGKKLYGGDDVIGIWPTWPTLGLDQRNQFDLFRDLPGGTPQLRLLADSLRAQGTKFFICYNPWDESTRSEGHLAGLATLIKETSADGVVLDTRGESSRELQAAADEVKEGVVMYSEGMAVPKNMPGIVAGRVHNALYYPPMLNLNKLIKPDFSIFRVAEVFKEPIQREYAVAFFNGYGTEINQFAAGHPDWEEDQLRYLGKTSRILRENTLNFTSNDFTPLIPTLRDSIWVNRWRDGDKTIYTIYSVIPQGFNSPLFEVEPDNNSHFVDLWHHEEVEPLQKNGRSYIRSHTNAFDRTFLGTNNEGEVDCIAQLPRLLISLLDGDEIFISSYAEGDIRIWAGDPSYEKEPVILGPDTRRISLTQHFGRYEGKFVIQLVENGILRDENIITIPPGTPRLITKADTTRIPSRTPSNMVKIPGGQFTFHGTNGDEFISYPKGNEGRIYNVPSFYMDKFPVTNLDFKKFIDATQYVPADTSNFLRHWKDGAPAKGEEKFPVTYVSYEDAQAYAKWAGKRLPTEVEWQYAAQTSSLNEWPWKQTKPVTRKEEPITETLTVTSIQGIDKKHANPGDGKRYPVGKFPKGANPFGLQDLVGCVWQLTNDIYQSGSYRYVMMKGGSYFKPSSSWWYVQGGPRELHYRQFLLRVSQGFERNATVGFRCVVDHE
jgi:gamma-glutamyl hercynylcysteine S-oxide synthase